MGVCKERKTPRTTERKQTKNEGWDEDSVPTCTSTKERKKTENPREGWEGIHGRTARRHHTGILRKERGVMR